ncbi:hypothetical protein BH20CHL6_BH20CHL6_12300 [soil metagenome]
MTSEDRREAARRLGVRLGRLIDEPEAFANVALRGLGRLAEPAYRAELARVNPGGRAALGVRLPLIAEIERGLVPVLRDASPASALYVAERLSRGEWQELRFLTHALLRHSIERDPERSWQLIRRLANGADDWISVDHLAALVAVGILFEPFRWSELEQLVYSPQPFERRLVGATVATIPFLVVREDRPGLSASPGLALVEQLMGDAHPQVQKALAWALRSWRGVDAAGVEDALRREAGVAIATRDGHRAWVVRASLTAQPASVQADLRSALSGLRRRRDAPSTSRATEVALAFGAPPASGDIVALSGERMGSFAR